MILTTMTIYDAMTVCRYQNANLFCESNSIIYYRNTSDQAKELFNHAVKAWSINDRHDHNPKAIFGYSPLSRTTVSAWCVVASQEKRVWGWLAKFSREITDEIFNDSNITRIHSMVSLSRPEPLRFAKKLGLSVLCELPGYGLLDIDFALMALTKKEWEVEHHRKLLFERV